jgi:AcrR family transcriptional regulator
LSKSKVRAATRGRDGVGESESDGTAPRRRLPAAERRELIEQAATRVFAEHGYAGASIDEIARRSDVSPPVVYDHFASKLDLFTRLLERTRDELLAMWIEQLAGDDPTDVRMRRSFDAWAQYVEANRFASRMYFLEATGDPQARAAHREIQAQGRAALSAILGQQPGAQRVARDGVGLEMAAETMRAGLAGLAIWWDEHPHIPRERIVETAMHVLWTGFERLQADAAETAG